MQAEGLKCVPNRAIGGFQKLGVSFWDSFIKELNLLAVYRGDPSFGSSLMPKPPKAACLR